MKKIVRLILTPLILLCLCSNIYSQGHDIKFDHVLNLGRRLTPVIHQDNDGFLWIGSYAGLFRYDGYDLKLFEAGTDSLSNGMIFCLLEDPKNSNIFWIGTFGGLNKFDKATNTFTYYRHNPNDPESLGGDRIAAIIQDYNNPDTLWLGTFNGGLNKFDKSTGKSKRYKYDPKNPKGPGSNNTWMMVEDESDPNILWIGSRGFGLMKFDKKTEIFKNFTHNPNKPDYLEKNGYFRIIQDEDNPDIIWIGNYSGISQFNTKTETVKFIKNTPITQVMYDDKKGALWLGGWVQNIGLVRFDKKTKKTVTYKPGPGNPYSLRSDTIVGFLEDRAGNFWITSYTGEVEKLDKYGQKFNLYRSGNTTGSLSDDMIISVFEDNDGYIWLGTKGGLNKHDKRTGLFSTYKHNPDDPNSLNADYIYGVLEGSSGYLWVSTFQAPATLFKVLQN